MAFPNVRLARRPLHFASVTPIEHPDLAALVREEWDDDLRNSVRVAVGSVVIDDLFDESRAAFGDQLS